MPEPRTDGPVAANTHAVPADPSVSPADTIRRLTEWLDSAPDSFPSYRMHEPTYRNPGDLRRDVRALLAVGERDKALLAQCEAALTSIEVTLFGDDRCRTRDELDERAEELAKAGERDRRQIARLTEALDARPITREHAFRAAQNAVRNQGYAVALHGSQIKDLDLIAVPWQETALTAQDVAELIAAAIPGFIEKGSPDAMPSGRLSFTIRPNWHYGFDHWWIDLAVMPRECDWPARAVIADEEDARP